MDHIFVENGTHVLGYWEFAQTPSWIICAEKIWDRIDSEFEIKRHLLSLIFAAWWGTPIMEVTRMLGSKDPLFSALLSPNDPIFLLIVSAVSHPKTPHFLVKCGLFNRSHPKTPYFLHSAATGSYFLFQFHQQIDHFCHFRQFFLLQIPAFKALTERTKVTFSPCPLILNQNLTSHPMTPHFLRLWSHWMPQPLEVWALHPYPFDIGVPPSPDLQILYFTFEGTVTNNQFLVSWIPTSLWILVN